MTKHKSELINLISNQKDNFPLEQSFYTNQEIYDLDINNILFNQWIFICHESRIQNKGDYFLFDIGKESIIVIRGDNKINCFYNVCRHRGSHICVNKEGRINKLVCPYHSWVYDLDGKLIKAQMMPENFEKENLQLHKCHSVNFEGLIFINLSDNPDDFNEFIKPTRNFIKLHGLNNAKIAFRKTYPTNGNWKLTLDNFHECYHCQTAHPEYCEVHSKDYIQAYGAGNNTGPESLEFSKKLDEWNRKTNKIGY